MSTRSARVLVLPGVDGITICRAVRAEGTNRDTPILMLTSRDRESDKVVGLESGADGYLTKPFAVRELLARVTAMMRRSARHHASSTTAAGFIRLRDLALDPDRRQAAIRGRGVELTKQEFDLLYLLASKPGIVFSRTALLGRLWQGDASITERTVDTIVSRLRRKVERDPQNPEMILTAWGVGYKFADVDE